MFTISLPPKRLKLPVPLLAKSIRYEGRTYWMEANSRSHAKKLAKALHDDMSQSVRLTNMMTAPTGHIGLGHAGWARALRGK